MRKPLRIAMVVDPWMHPYNGLVVSTRRFVRALEADGCEVRLLVVRSASAETPPGGVDFAELNVPGFNHIMRSMRAPVAVPERSRARAALDGCDLLHVQYPFFLGHAAITEARKMGLPVVSTFHIQPENILRNLGLPDAALRPLLYRLFVRSFYDRSTVVVAPSEFAADQLRRHGAKRPIEVISNGVPDAFFNVARANVKDGRFHILSVGRLAKEKRQETLLHAVARSPNRDRIDLTLAGVGPRQEMYQSLADRLDLDAAIGPVSDETLLRLYGEADLFVHSSTVELEGMSVLEAMAAGLPVLVSSAGDSAAASLVPDAEMRFAPGDIEGLGARIDAWIANPQGLADVGRANRELASRFTHARSVDALIKTYKLALEAAP